MMDTLAGTCGNCGGRVIRHGVLYMVGPPPPPSCERCGAIPQQYVPPVLPMAPGSGIDNGQRHWRKGE